VRGYQVPVEDLRLQTFALQSGLFARYENDVEAVVVSEGLKLGPRYPEYLWAAVSEYVLSVLLCRVTLWCL
jgi:hypothetical protein